MHPWISSELYTEHRRQLLEQAAAYRRWTEGRQAKSGRRQWHVQSPVVRRHRPGPTTLTICR